MTIFASLFMILSVSPLFGLAMPGSTPKAPSFFMSSTKPVLNNQATPEQQPNALPAETVNPTPAQDATPPTDTTAPAPNNASETMQNNPSNDAFMNVIAQSSPTQNATPSSMPDTTASNTSATEQQPSLSETSSDAMNTPQQAIPTASEESVSTKAMVQSMPDVSENIPPMEQNESSNTEYASQEPEAHTIENIPSDNQTMDNTPNMESTDSETIMPENNTTDTDNHAIVIPPTHELPFEQLTDQQQLPSTEYDIASDENQEINNTIDADESMMVEDKVIVVMNATGAPLSIYGQYNDTETCLAKNLDVITKIIVPGHIEMLRIKQADTSSRTTLIPTENLSILTISASTDPDTAERALNLHSIEPEEERTLILYNASTNTQIIKVSFPDDASFFSTPHVYYNLPPLSVRTVTVPSFNKNNNPHKLHIGLPHSRKKLHIKPNIQTISCVVYEQDNVVMIDNISDDFN